MATSNQANKTISGAPLCLVFQKPLVSNCGYPSCYRGPLIQCCSPQCFLWWPSLEPAPHPRQAAPFFIEAAEMIWAPWGHLSSMQWFKSYHVTISQATRRWN
jgi:hypothetical protein